MTAAKQEAHLTREDIAHRIADLDDVNAAEIIAAGATIQELDEAVAWAAGESDAMGKLRHPLTGKTAQIYDILTATEEPEDQA